MKPFAIISEQEEYKDGSRFSVIKAHLKTPENKEVDWRYLKSRDGVIVVAITDTKKIYIKREWRLNRKDFTWEFPSGWVEKENPTEADILESGNKELQEEIGFKAQSLKKVLSFYVMNHSTSKFHVVLATDLQESKLPFDENEHVESKLVSIEEARKILIEDQIPTAQVVITFQEALKII